MARHTYPYVIWHWKTGDLKGPLEDLIKFRAIYGEPETRYTIIEKEEDETDQQI